MKLRSDAAIFLYVFCALLWIPSPSFAEIRYVNVNSTNPVVPYTNWSTAARTIQAATDISADGDLVLVTNGYYRSGGVTNFPESSGLTNRLAITNAITVRSVNGPGVTFIVGGGPLGGAAIRGVFMAPGSILSGFTVSNGYTKSAGEYDYERSGGGVWCSDASSILTNCIVADNVSGKDGAGVYGGTLYNCTLARNNAVLGFGGGSYYGSLQACTLRDNLAFQGGGAYYSVLINCIIVSNFAYDGGGAYNGYLYHCTVVTNEALQFGGGAYEGTLENCIVYHNNVVATNQDDNWYNGTLTYTCTDPLPTGEGNITNEPVFVSMPAGNLRLMSNSPCIDAGLNGVVVLDVVGIPRPLDGNLDGTNTADMGAYEFVHPAGDSDQDGMLDPWEIDNRLNPLDPADAALDPDADGPVSHDEFIAGTDPNNSNSYFRFTRVRQSATNELVTWSSATGRVYSLERITIMTGDTWTNVVTGLPARPPENTYTDAVPAATLPCFYRVWVNRTNAYYPP
jgi:hypothetical protein